jgi:drug/metabolite transporter (DMT)-like permease
MNIASIVLITVLLTLLTVSVAALSATTIYLWRKERVRETQNLAATSLFAGVVLTLFPFVMDGIDRLRFQKEAKATKQKTTGTGESAGKTGHDID